MNLDQVLADLKATLSDREGNYSDPAPMFERISRLNAVIDEAPAGAEREILRLIGLKICRVIHALIAGKNPVDSWRDIAGYAVLGLMLATKKEGGG